MVTELASLSLYWDPPFLQGSGPARSHPLYLAGGGEGDHSPEVVSFNILLNKNFCKYPAQNQNGIFYFPLKKKVFNSIQELKSSFCHLILRESL